MINQHIGGIRQRIEATHGAQPVRRGQVLDKAISRRDEVHTAPLNDHHEHAATGSPLRSGRWNAGLPPARPGSLRLGFTALPLGLLGNG